MAEIKGIVNITARDYANPEDVIIAQTVQDTLNYTLDKTDVPLVFETLSEFCLTCNGVCKYCNLPRFAEELGTKMVLEYMDKLKGESG